MPRLRLIVSYVGTNYCGWQIQAYPDGRKAPTVQAELEAIATRVCNTPIRMHGSGRTDSGVHADHQVVHCDIPENRLSVDWVRAFNKQLPDDIAVLKAELVPDTFHSRFSAIQKEYTYRLWLSRNFTPPHLTPFVWTCGKLDVDAMRHAASFLTGEHDFASLQNAGTEITSTIRTVSSITFVAFQHHGLSLPPTSHTETIPCEHLPLELRWHFTANGFLKQMVRNLMGLMVACGRGKFLPSDIPDLLNRKDRTLAPPTAPAHGLIMTNVHFKPFEP